MGSSASHAALGLPPVHAVHSVPEVWTSPPILGVTGLKAVGAGGAGVGAGVFPLMLSFSSLPWELKDEFGVKLTSSSGR